MWASIIFFALGHQKVRAGPVHRPYGWRPHASRRGPRSNNGLTVEEKGGDNRSIGPTSLHRTRKQCDQTGRALVSGKGAAGS